MSRSTLWGGEAIVFIKRGLFAQLISGKATPGFYIFNPDDSGDRFTVFSRGVKF